MQEKKFEFTYKVFDKLDDLDKSDQALLTMAREATKSAYAPYSRFNVGAAAIVEGGKTVTGTNQENASFPVGICAERSLLATAATLFPGKAIETMAISYSTGTRSTDKPISPCGMCRQALQEYELRTGKKMRIILGGQSGPIYIIEGAQSLLPLGFSGESLQDN